MTCPECGSSHQIRPDPDWTLLCPDCGAEVPLRPSPVAGEPPIQVIEDEPATTRLRCAGCGHYYPASTVVCTRCGINLVTGERLATQDDLSRAGAREESLSIAHRILGLFPGFFHLRTLLPAVLLVLVSFATFALFLFFLGLGVLFTAVAIGAVGLILYAQAIVWILLGELMLIHEGLAEFDSARWNVFFLLLFLPAAVIFLLAWRFANFIRG